jgi:HEAT repeat protein
MVTTPTETPRTVRAARRVSKLQDEAVTQSHPLVALQTDLERMVKHLRLSDWGTLLIVTTPDADVEAALAVEVARRLRGELIVRNFRFGDSGQLSLSRHLRTLPYPTGQAALFVFGLDDLLPNDRADAILSLNLGRGRLAQAGYSVVLWVRPATLSDLTLRAPDFFSWRSGVFQFDLTDDPARRQEMLAALRLSAPLELDDLYVRYLDYLIASFRWLDFRGLLQVRNNVVRLSLEEVYVPLLGMEYGVQSIERQPDEAESLYRLLPTRTTLADALRKHQRMVVLGDPGSGKTTLLKYVALEFAQACREGQETTELGPVHFPVLLSIAGYASARRAIGGRLPILGYLPRYFAELGLKGVEQMIQARLADGRCIVLLDGLDEVLSPAERAGVVTELEGLVQAYGDNHFLVTSRIAGYSSAPLPADFTPFVIQPFGPSEIASFARQWSRAFEAIGYTGPPPPEAEIRAAAHAEKLVSAIKSHPAVQKLAANPLLLTMLTLIHRQGARLPRHRVDLYRLCVETLAETWNLARSLSGRPINLYLGERRLDADLVGRILAPLALWMHKTQPGGLAMRDALEAQIVTWFREQEGTAKEEAKALAHDFLELIREQSGLLIERGLDQFAFMHLTFQEYLAARCVAGGRDPFFLIKPHLHDPHWREVILLTAGLLGSFSEDWATDFVRSIRQADSTYNEVLHRDLLLACRSLADDVPLARDLRESLLADLLALWRETPYRKLREETNDLLTALGRSEVGLQVAHRLLVALHDNDADVQVRATEAFRVLGRADEDVVQGLLTALDNEDVRVRWGAAMTLRELGRTDEALVQGGLATLRDRGVEVRRNATRALTGGLGRAGDAVLQRLLSSLHDESSAMQARAAIALGELGWEDEDVIHGLLTGLRDEEVDVRARAAMGLGELGWTDEVVIQGLLTALRDEVADVRRNAVKALRRLGPTDEAVVQGLLAALRDEDVRVRWDAAEALGNLGQADKAVIQGMLAILHDEMADVRRKAAEALGRLGRADEAVIQGLLVTLCDEHNWVRQSAAEALGMLGRADEAVIQGLLVTLCDEHSWVRRSATEALGSLGWADEAVMQGLLTALRDEDSGVRENTAEALGRLSWTDEAVTQGLLAALRDEDVDVRVRVAWALGELGQAGETVIQGLLTTLCGEAPSVRESAAKALGRLGQLSPYGYSADQIGAALVSALRDKSNQVRAAAAWALGQLGQAEPAVFKSLRRLLDLERSREVIWYPTGEGTDLIRKRGPAYDAFFAALWTLAEKLAVDEVVS